MAISSKQAKTGDNPSGMEVGLGGGVGSGGEAGGGTVGGISPADFEEIFYFGHYTHGCDDKKRVQVPSKWRPRRPEVLENYEVNVVFWKRDNQETACLQVFPPNEMKRLLRLVRKKSWGDPQAETLRRALGGMCEIVKYDRVGRICIPDSLAKPAGIEKNTDVILVGLMDVYQIWNIKRYQAAHSKDEVTMPQALSLLDDNESEPQ